MNWLTLIRQRHLSDHSLMFLCLDSAPSLFLARPHSPTQVSLHFVHFHDRNQPVLCSASPPYGEFILLSIPLLHRTAFYDLNVHFYYIPARAVLVIKSVSDLKNKYEWDVIKFTAATTYPTERLDLYLFLHC